MSALFAFFLIPETKGLSLEQIDRMMQESTPMNSRRWKPHETYASRMGMAAQADVSSEEVTPKEI